MNYKKVISLALLLVILLISTSSAESRKAKLKRGVINFLTGWVEIPKNIYDTSVEKNKLSGCTIGLIDGIGMAIVRTGAGLYEMTTFPWPIPEDYQVILEPEFVFNDGGGQEIKEESYDSQRSDITAEGGAGEGTRIEGLTVGSSGI